MALTPVTVSDRSGNSQGMEAYQDPAGNNIPIVSLDTNKATYYFSASFTPLVTSALTVLRIAGSASKTVRVKRIQVGGTSTAAGSCLYGLQRVSSVGTGGTGVTPTAAKADSASAAATAVVTHYTTAAQSAGTAAGGTITQATLLTSIVTLPTTGMVPLYSIFPPQGAPIGSSLVLRGTADALELGNLNGGNLPAGTVLQYTVELEEDAS